MAETQLEHGRRLLTLKGVAIEEEKPRLKNDSEWILEQYRKKKVSTQDLTGWDELDGTWNPDDTLSRLTFYKNGEILYQLDFIWNANGTFNKAIRTNGGER